jgi:hypothetical protein
LQWDANEDAFCFCRRLVVQQLRRVEPERPLSQKTSQPATVSKATDVLGNCIRQHPDVCCYEDRPVQRLNGVWWRDWKED